MAMFFFHNQVITTLQCHTKRCENEQYNDAASLSQSVSSEISDFIPCVILHIKYVEKTDDYGFGVLSPIFFSS